MIKGNIMKKTGNRLLVTILTLITVFTAVFALPIKAEAAGNGQYWHEDLFTPDRPIKGTQSFMDSERKDTYNTFINAFIDDGFIDDNKSNKSGFTEYTFEGDTYYFKVPDGIYNSGVISGLNDQNLTVTVQLLVRNQADKQRLIEPSARAHTGFKYYAPNMTEPAVVKEYRAYMNFLAEIFSKYNCHIDCWVCGNEVNAPDMWNFFGDDCMYDAGGGRWGISNYDLMMEKYTKWYDIVYDAVKSRNSAARVCACLDHCWTEKDNGKVFPARTFLDMFAAKEGNAKDWCVAYHCYPASLYQTDIWSNHTYNPKSESARFVDGYNLEILTGYIKKNFGTNHRVMLTEQGFSDARGTDKQAACLVYTYYKAKFDDMIDVFHIMKFKDCGFELSEPAATIWKYLDDGDATHEQWIFDQVKGTIGVSSWYDIVPDWKSEATCQADRTAYREINKYMFEGISYAPVFDLDYYVASNPAIPTYFGKNPPEFNDMFYYFSRYGMDMGQNASPNFILEDYKAAHPELVAQFGDNNREYYRYYCQQAQDEQDKAKEEQVKEFVKRFYVTILQRPYDDQGLSDWANVLLSKQLTASEVAHGFVFSEEFVNKGYGNEKFVARMYAAFFGRESSADPEGAATWIGALSQGYSRDFVFAGFVNSDEFRNICVSYGMEAGYYDPSGAPSNPQPQQPEQPQNPQPSQTQSGIRIDASGVDPAKLDEFMERLYNEALGRPSDPEGKTNWANAIINGQYDAGTVARYGFFASDEYLNKNKTPEEFVHDAYRAFFGRDEDQGGYDMWVNAIKDGTYTRDQVIEAGFGYSDEFIALLESYGFKVYR